MSKWKTDEPPATPLRLEPLQRQIDVAYDIGTRRGNELGAALMDEIRKLDGSPACTHMTLVAALSGLTASLYIHDMTFMTQGTGISLQQAKDRVVAALARVMDGLKALPLEVTTSADPTPSELATLEAQGVDTKNAAFHRAPNGGLLVASRPKPKPKYDA